VRAVESCSAIWSPSGWNSYEQLSKRRQDLIVALITGSRDGREAVDYTVNTSL